MPCSGTCGPATHRIILPVKACFVKKAVKAKSQGTFDFILPRVLPVTLLWLRAGKGRCER